LEEKMMANQQEPGSVVSEFSAQLVAADGTSYELVGEMTLGRSQDADITIAHAKISRSHARFRVTGQQLTVEDLGSANGTRVNQRRIEGAAILCDGDIVSFDTVDLGVVITGVIDAGDATVVNFSDEATVVGTSIGSAPAGSPVVAAQAPPPKSRAEAPAAVAKPSAPAPVDARAADLPGSWVDESIGEHTQVLSGLEAAAHASPGAKLDSTSDLTHLIIIMKSGAQQVMELEPAGGGQAEVWEIGRDEGCQIVIPEDSVSARHAQLVHQDGRWRLVNLVSTNGIYVNGKKRLTAYLADGDEIKLGMAALIFKSGSAVVNTSKNASGRSTGGTGRNLLLPIALAVGATVAAVGLWLLLR
jgi:pSer/pThr/pTyr-binding forkhead associated (FHA) protein